jgi:hypothetical protein
MEKRKMEIDLRKTKQYFKGNFYIYNHKKFVDIGFNGTSYHTRITKSNFNNSSLKEYIKYLYFENLKARGL